MVGDSVIAIVDAKAKKQAAGVRLTRSGSFRCSCNSYVPFESRDLECWHITEARDHFSNVFAGAVHTAMRISDEQGESLISYKGRSYTVKSKQYESSSNGDSSNLN